MITRDNFAKIVNALDEFWNDKNEHLTALGIQENYFHDFADTILDTLEKEVDPKHTARDDKYAYDCGAYICDWLFSSSDLRKQCLTAADLYDYIVAKYQPIENA